MALNPRGNRSVTLGLQGCRDEGLLLVKGFKVQQVL